jgi:hypothetical protein
MDRRGFVLRVKEPKKDFLNLKIKALHPSKRREPPVQ